MRAMIWQIGQEVGDGGSAAAVLARAIFNESARLTAAGFNPIVLAKGIQAGCEEVVQYLRDTAVPIGDEDELAALAHSIIDDPELAQVMGEMSYLLGPDAHINVHKFVAPYLQQFYHPGGHYKAQIASMHFYTDKAHRKAVLPAGRIALVDKNIGDPVDAIAILQAAHAAQASTLTILANNFSDQVIGLLMANNRPPQNREFDESALDVQEPNAVYKGKLPITAIQMKFVGEERVAAYQDLALLTGATIVGSDISKAAEDIAAEDLGAVNRVVRYREVDNTLVEAVVLLDDIPAARFHDGGRLRFGPDGYLYVAMGDALEEDDAQDLASPSGKIIRIDRDGTTPASNPRASPVYSYGHRNPQGFDWHPVSGALWATEHGNVGNDEVNLITAGANYGWPVIEGMQTMPGMETPVLSFSPSIAPSGGSFHTANAIPAFRHDFFFGALQGEHLHRVQFDRADPTRVIGNERLLEGRFGRLRDVVTGPDGALYVLTNNRDGRGRPHADDDRIIRLVAAG